MNPATSDPHALGGDPRYQVLSLVGCRICPVIDQRSPGLGSAGLKGRNPEKSLGAGEGKGAYPTPLQ